MLVLTRRAGESVMIGSDVTVRVIEIRGDVVRIGVDAPREVQVHREEVFHAVRAANLEAAAASSPGSLDALRAGLAGLGGAAGAPTAPSTAPPAPADAVASADALPPAGPPAPAATGLPKPGPRAPQP